MSLILRREKGSKLTTDELDGNFTYLESLGGGESSTYRTVTDSNDGETLLATDRTVFVQCSYQQIDLTMPDPTESGGFYGYYLLAFHASKSLGIEILLFFLALILQLASCFLFNMIFGLFYLLTEGIDNPIFGLYSIFFGFLTRKMKKIYYSDLGYFYASYGSDDVMIFRQDILALKYLFTCEYDGDINSLNRSIESNLKKIYGEELREKRKRDAFKNWDGYIDTPSKRDDKIKKILQ